MECKDKRLMGPKICKDLAQINVLYVEDLHYHNTKINILNQSSTMNNSLSTKP
jgi:hypothetical protein